MVAHGFVDPDCDPTPFEVGRTNCYVFASEELTLLDPGPATDEASEVHAEGLQELGYAPPDVDRVRRYDLPRTE